MFRNGQCPCLAVRPTQHAGVLDEERGVHIQGEKVDLRGFCRRIAGGVGDSGSHVIPQLIHVVLRELSQCPQSSGSTIHKRLGGVVADAADELLFERKLLVPCQLGLLVLVLQYCSCSCMDCSHLLNVLLGPQSVHNFAAQSPLSSSQLEGSCKPRL